jgi:multicomponent Na+:H+ antiporter subunit G
MDILTGILLLIGAIFILLSAIGVLRMPDLFTRMSATTKASTFGTGFVLIAAALFFFDAGIAARSLVIILFLFLTAPVSAHMIARAAYFDGVPLWEKTIVDELKGKYHKKKHHLLSDKPVKSDTE